jgi:hypothetical protein
MAGDSHYFFVLEKTGLIPFSKLNICYFLLFDFFASKK